MVRLSAVSELFLDKPVTAINTDTYWHALRATGIQDKRADFASLMEHHGARPGLVGPKTTRFSAR